jgi:hypothetical protein
MATNQKLTAMTLIAMAAKQGIRLQEVGAADGAQANEPNVTSRAMNDAAILIEGLRKDLASAESNAARSREAYKNVSADAVAKAGRILVLERELKALSGERDGLVAGRDRMVERIRVLTEELASRPTLNQDKLTLALTRERDEARADVAALERTVAKLRAAGDALALRHQPQAPIVDEAGATQEASEAVSAAVDTAEHGPCRAWRVSFNGPQGFGTADKLKAIGARWKVTSWKGEPMRGYWLVPHTHRTEAVLNEIRGAGRSIQAEAIRGE